MKIFRNRTVIGVLCILLALVICFGVTPLFSRSASEKAEIVRVTADIKEGDEACQNADVFCADPHLFPFQLLMHQTVSLH